MSFISNIKGKGESNINLRFWIVSILFCLSIFFCSCESGQDTEFHPVNSDLPTITVSKSDGTSDVPAQESTLTDSQAHGTTETPVETESETAVTNSTNDGEDTAKYTPNY